APASSGSTPTTRPTTRRRGAATSSPDLDASSVRTVSSTISRPSRSTSTYRKRRSGGIEMGVIRLAGAIPGPRSLALMERRRQSVLAGVATLRPIFVERAQDSTVTDVDGNTFIDFTGGIGVMNAGHGHPAVVSAIATQANAF